LFKEEEIRGGVKSAPCRGSAGCLEGEDRKGQMNWARRYGCVTTQKRPGTSAQ